MTSLCARVGGALLICARLASGCVVDVALVRAPDAATPRRPMWEPVPSATTQNLAAVWGASPTDVWAVGSQGTAIHWDGASWRTVPTGTTAALTGVWAASASDAWAVGSDPAGLVLLRWNGTEWLRSALMSRERVTLRDVWGSGPRDVWAVGGSPDSPEPGVWRWDGDLWRPEFMPGGRGAQFYGISGDRDGFWIAGLGIGLFQHDALGWSVPAMPPRGVMLGGAVCVGGDRAVWLTGPGEAIYRYTGSVWATTSATPGPWRALWCGRQGPVAAGDRGQIARWNGASWATEPAGTDALAGLWGTDDGTVWAVGAAGAVRRFTP